jgi:hypothetical protein
MARRPKALLHDRETVYSMGHHGDCWDNVVVQSWTRRCRSNSFVITDVKACAAIYKIYPGMVECAKRLHSTLGYVNLIAIEERALRDSADSARR